MPLSLKLGLFYLVSEVLLTVRLAQPHRHTPGDSAFPHPGVEL